MAWLKKDWWKIKKRPTHQNGRSVRVDANTVLLPRRIRKIAETMDPRRVLAWTVALTAAVVYCVFRWKRLETLEPVERPEDPAEGETEALSPVRGLAERIKSFILPAPRD